MTKTEQMTNLAHVLALTVGMTEDLAFAVLSNYSRRLWKSPRQRWVRIEAVSAAHHRYKGMRATLDAALPGAL